MRMRGRIGLFSVRAQIGLDFNDAPGDELPLFCLSDEYFAEEKLRHALRRRLKEGPLQQPARQFDLLPPPHAAHSDAQVHSFAKANGVGNATRRLADSLTR
jgi:hypothetical protein